MLRFVSRFGALVVVVALVVLGATGRLFSPAPAAVAAQLLAIGLAVWARRAFPTGGFRVGAEPGADALIRRGPYRLIRHPMYTAALLFIWAAVLAHLSWLSASVAVVVSVTIAVRIVLEERVLRDRFADYASYARETKALLPYLL